jgi:signal transduction histidine kinase
MKNMTEKTAITTTQNLPCPHCGGELQKDEKTCPNCGVDLLLLTLLTERAYLDGVPGAAPISTSPESLIPRIGDYLLDHGLITHDQLAQALERQLAINLQIIELNSALREANRTLEQRVSERTSELKGALERLSEANQIKANLISNVSHELRTPLAHIKGYVELILEGDLGTYTDEQEDALHVMQRSTSRLEQLIEDLIEFSTGAREGISLNQEPVSVLILAKQIADRTREKSKKAKVELNIDLDDSLPKVQADAKRLEWVIYQLIDNGIKFTPAGGEVTLGAKSDGDIVEIYVRDTGMGIPEDRIKELFLPFHQLDGSPTRRHGGTGLGLALVKMILDSHGTEIKVESFPDQGSLISFSLPVYLEKA